MGDPRRLARSLAAYELLLDEVATVADPREEDPDRIAELSDIVRDGAREAADEVTDR